MTTTPRTSLRKAGLRIDGHAVVSADGMIADENGLFPPELIIDADQQRFQNALDASALVVLGRKGHERHPDKGRRRLVVTRGTDGLTTDPTRNNIHFWNPEGMAFADVADRLEIHQGTIAITGGQSVFDLFVGHYDRFVLALANNVTIPKGIACFGSGSPDQVLARSGMQAGPSETIAEHVTQTIWRATAGGTDAATS